MCSLVEHSAAEAGRSGRGGRAREWRAFAEVSILVIVGDETYCAPQRIAAARTWRSLASGSSRVRSTARIRSVHRTLNNPAWSKRKRMSLLRNGNRTLASSRATRGSASGVKTRIELLAETVDVGHQIGV